MRQIQQMDRKLTRPSPTALLLTLVATVRSARKQLDRKIRSSVWQRQSKRLDRTLARLDSIPAEVDIRELAIQYYLHALRSIERRLSHKLRLNKRIHPLRIKMRSARDVAEMLIPSGHKLSTKLHHRLDAMQASLGALHDSIQFASWVAKNTRFVSSGVAAAVATLAEQSLNRAQEHRRALRRSIHRMRQKNATLKRGSLRLSM